MSLVRKNLMDIVTLSGIRKELLLYLNEGPRSLSEIRDQFDITSPEVSPRIKELLEHNLVKFENKKYHMTPMGKAIIKNFLPFLNTINVFDQYLEFWKEHDLSSIPDELLYRINEIKNYIIIEDDLSDMDRTRTEFFKVVNSSKSFVGVSCMFVESLPELCLNAVKNDIPIKIVITKSIFSTLKKNYTRQIGEFLANDNAELYVSNDEIKVSHVVTDDCLYFSLYYKNGRFDINSNIISDDPSSVQWGRDLFEYYRKRANKIEI
jgi:predicted transcriptional regulator